MLTKQFTCPRCLFSEVLRPAMRFCPRCGLPDAKEAWVDKSPIDLTVGRRTYRVMDRIAIGSICAIYRCRFSDDAKQVEGVFKVARDACSNAMVINESAVLRRLHAAPGAEQFIPFIPRVADTLGMADGSTPARQANILQMHEGIASLEELYTLDEVVFHYPRGLDPRHVAWIWRRVLTVLGFAHSNQVTHSAVLPMHVLIEPRGHKLVLIDWCAAAAGDAGLQPVRVIAAGYIPWYKRQGALLKPPTGALDIGLGARCMIELLGGDPVSGQLPASVDPALARYFSRCLSLDAAPSPDAWKLLDDFDRLIEALWGPRKYVALELPPKQRS